MLDMQRQQLQLVWSAIPELNLIEEATVIPAGQHRFTFVLQAKGSHQNNRMQAGKHVCSRQSPAELHKADIRSRAGSPPVVFIQGVVINGPTCTVTLQLSRRPMPCHKAVC